MSAARLVLLAEISGDKRDKKEHGVVVQPIENKKEETEEL